MEVSYNARCPAVKRLLKEAQELHEATEEYYAHPLEDNLFEWHFTVRGPPETEFEGGVYHGRIIMPAEYPMKPPNIIFFTPNGRFETNKKICLSISGHHPETWQPSWSIRTALLAIIGFMPTPSNGTIGSLDYTAAERAALSKKSVEYLCPNCGCVGNLLKERTGVNAAFQKEAKDVSAQMVVSGKPEDYTDEPKSSMDSQTEESSQHSSTEFSPPVSMPSDDSNIQPVTPSANGVSPADISSLTESYSIPAPATLLPSLLSQESPSLTSSPASPSLDTSTVPPPSSLFQPPSSSTPPSRQSSYQNSVALIANNIFLSAAAFLLIALVLRRLFLLEAGTSEELEDILL